MSRSVGLAHVVREGDGSTSGLWGPFALRSAFQPIFAFNGGRLSVAAFEGLARPFRDGQGLGAGAFFAAVPEPDRFHVDALLRTIHLLNAGAFLPRDALIFINFDPSVLSGHAVADAVLRDLRLTLHEAGIEPGRLVCEMTEQRLSSAESFLYFIEALRRHGFRIAVDDYGAQDSDMERIRAVAPDIVKFDARWITRLMESGPGFALLAALVDGFAAQNIRTVFEGIEEGWQLDLAERAGASMVQGYVLRRPELVPTSFAVTSTIAAGPRVNAADGMSAPTAVARDAGAPRPARAFGRRT
jgi:EAL domain-containing protein (putative c-di-GMP-specific phosphodiesterase class I)